MEATISKTNINKYEVDHHTAGLYFYALQALHDGRDIGEHSIDKLTKAGLYSNGKLRVFNYKRPKSGYSVSPEVKNLFMLWGKKELAAATWYKNKTFVEAMQILVDAHGLSRMQNTIHILVPLGNKHTYISTIRNPQQLLANYGEEYKDRFTSEGVLKENQNFINTRKRELQLWNDQRT